MKKFLLLSLLLGATLHGLTPDEALTKLKEGNLRFAQEKLEHPNRGSERRLDTRAGQDPFATILGCADSRASPEILFDQGIGDLFIVRVAGNCLGPLEKSSILYSVLVLNTCLIVVLGHENCGAVDAALTGAISAFPDLAAQIEPAIKGSTELHKAIEKNVVYVTKHLEELPELKDKLASKQLRVVGGVYDFKTGRVQFLL